MLKNHFRWVPSAYIMQGLPFALVTEVSVILFKNLGLANAQITLYTSLLIAPWLIKFITAPLLENISSKRSWMLIVLFILPILCLLLAASLSLTHYFYPSLCVFFCIAIVSSTYDLTIDGFYITNLDIHSQARYIGIRTIAYQVGRVISQGGIVFIASLFFLHMSKQTSWGIAFCVLAGLILSFAIYQYYFLPNDQARQITKQRYSPYQNFVDVFSQLLKFPHLAQIVCFTFLYNFSQYQLDKIIPLFLLDSLSNGGLGLSTRSLAVLNGGAGIASLLVGVAISGFILEKFSLRKSFVPITIFYGFTSLGYLLLSIFPNPSVSLVMSVIIIAQLGFGISNGAYMFFLIRYFGKEPYAMSFYSIGITFMVFSMMVGGSASGFLQSLLGYQHFFLWAVCLNFFSVLFSIYLISKGRMTQ